MTFKNGKGGGDSFTLGAYASQPRAYLNLSFSPSVRPSAHLFVLYSVRLCALNNFIPNEGVS